MTIVWPTGPTPVAGGVTIASALAAADSIDARLSEACTTFTPASLKIRWPNDLLLGGSKVGGLLGESVSADGRRAMLLGVGINVNNKVDDLGDGLRTPAESLARWAGRPVDLGEFLEDLAASLVRAIDAFEREGITDSLRERILARLADMGKHVGLEGGGGPVEGVLVGIGDEGELVLEAEGRRRAYVSGELSCRAAD